LIKQRLASHRPDTFAAILLVVLVISTALACSANEDVTEFLSTETIWIDLPEFVIAVRAGHVEDIVVNESEISFRYDDTPQDYPTYKTRMEPGTTFEQVLLDAGFEPEEFPAFEVR
jgi:hypothetical protein